MRITYRCQSPPNATAYSNGPNQASSKSNFQNHLGGGYEPVQEVH